MPGASLSKPSEGRLVKVRTTAPSPRLAAAHALLAEAMTAPVASKAASRRAFRGVVR